MSADQMLTKNNISNIPPFLSKICDVNLDFKFKRKLFKNMLGLPFIYI